MSHHEYFAAYWEAFGVADGMGMWEGLLAVLPEPNKQQSLQRLMVPSPPWLHHIISLRSSPLEFNGMTQITG